MKVNMKINLNYFRDSFIMPEKSPKEHLLRRGVGEVLWCYEDENSQVLKIFILFFYKLQKHKNNLL